MQAFKSYDEAGVPRRIHCLKYLVLASMLMGSQVRVLRSRIQGSWLGAVSASQPWPTNPRVAGVLTPRIAAWLSHRHRLSPSR